MGEQSRLRRPELKGLLLLAPTNPNLMLLLLAEDGGSTKRMLQVSAGRQGSTFNTLLLAQLIPGSVQGMEALPRDTSHPGLKVSHVLPAKALFSHPNSNAEMQRGLAALCPLGCGGWDPRISNNTATGLLGKVPQERATMWWDRQIRGLYRDPSSLGSQESAERQTHPELWLPKTPLPGLNRGVTRFKH